MILKRFDGAQDGAFSQGRPGRPRGVREADGPLHLAAASCEVFYLPEESCKESFGGGLTTRACLLRRGRRIASRIPPGLGPWIEGPWRRDVRNHGLGSYIAGSLDAKASRGSLGGVLGLLFGVLGVSWSRPGESRGVLERPWRRGALLDASWGALAGLRGPQKVIGNGSWTARGHRGDWFQHCLEAKYPPKRSPGESQIEVQKRSGLKIAKP